MVLVLGYGMLWGLGKNEKRIIGGLGEEMKLTKEEWDEEYKKKYDEVRELHPDWDSDKVKMVVSRDMPKQTDEEGWE